MTWGCRVSTASPPMGCGVMAGRARGSVPRTRRATHSSIRATIRAMRILHIVQLYYPVASGAGRYFAEVGERLAAEGHTVTVLSTDAYDLEYFWNSARRW